MNVILCFHDRQRANDADDERRLIGAGSDGASRAARPRATGVRRSIFRMVKKQ
jgi:hypothetical protein